MSKKVFFYRIDAGDLLDFATNPDGENMTVFQFAKELKKGSSDIPFIQGIIDEANGYIEKKKDAAHKRWNAPHMQNDAPHMQNGKVHMPEAVTEAEAVTEKKQKKESKSSRFTPPTIEEVKAYCLERKNGVNADKWFNHYASKGWKVGREGMKDWKAAVRTWESDVIPPQNKVPEADHRRYL